MNRFIQDKRVFTPGFITDNSATQRTKKHTRRSNGGKRGGGRIIGPTKFF